MPSIKYINQSAPFWDFIANMEQNGAQHPFAQAFGAGENEEQQSYGWGPFGGFPHRPHPNHHRGGLRGRHGPPGGPHGRRGPQPPPEGFGSGSGPSDGEFSEGEVSPPKYDEKEGSPATEKGEPPNAPHADECHEGRRGKCNGRKGEKGERAHSHGRRGPHGPHGPHGFHGKRGGPGGPGGPHGFGGRGPPWARRGGFPFGGFGGSWGDFFNQTRNEASEQNNFKPEVDVFDTETAYVVHLSLPGAKKEDVGVSWDSEKSQLTVSGVVHRPGDEEFLQTLALDERKVGAFEREVRLGSLANPASVDVDAISAKLEDGILRIEVPKLDKDYIEVKMVDIE